MVEYQPVITVSKATTQRCSLRFPRRFLSVLSLFILAKNRRHFPHSYFHIDGNKHSSLRASSPGALTAGREKEEELATTSLEFWLAEMTLVMMSNDVNTLGTCFSMFVYIRAPFRFALIVGNLTAQSTRSHRKLETEFIFQRRCCKLSFLFPPHHQSAPESFLAGYKHSTVDFL